MSIPIRKTLKGRRAVVIGSDAAALSAAISLAVRGARVVLLEEGDDPAAALRPCRIGPYRCDPFPPFIADPALFSQLFADADSRFSDFLSLNRVKPLCRFIFEGGERLDLHCDPHECASEIAQLDKRDAARIPAFYRSLSRLYQRVRLAQERRLAGGVSPGGLAAPLRFMQKITPLRPLRTAQAVIDGNFQNPQVRAAFRHLLFLHGIPATNSEAATSFAAGREWTCGGWYPEEGPDALASALLRVAELAGVRIIKNAAVREIELKSGRVRSVSGDGFKPITTSIVVSAADPLHTMDVWCSSLTERPELCHEIAGRKPGWSRLVLRLGCSRKWSDQLSHLTIFPANDFESEIRQLDRWGVPPEEPTIAVANPVASDDTCAPAGHSALTIATHAPPFGIRYKWTADRIQFERDRILGRLQSCGMAELSNKIVEESVLSPEDIAARTRSRCGSIQSAGGTSLSAGLPCRVREVPGLYLANDTLQPGGSLSSALLSGMVAAACAAEDAS